MPKVSIITINLNNKAGLEKTIKSVIEQTYIDFEYIVVDGGSEDGSVDSIQQNKDKITRWISEKDSGRYNAMNKGIGMANGEYCLFLNSGDYLVNSEIIAKVFKEEKGQDILYGELIFDFGKGRKDIAKLPVKLDVPYLYNDNIWHPATFIKRVLFHQAGGYNEKYKIAADYDFFFNVIGIKKVNCLYLPFPVSVYDTMGLSSLPENMPQILSERALIHQAYLNEEEIRVLENRQKLKSARFKKYQKITFFTPTMNRTGSEIVLLNMLSKLNNQFRAVVIAKYKGVLLDLLPSNIKKKVLYKKPVKYAFPINSYTLKRLFETYCPKIIFSIKVFMYKNTLWYVNTITLPEVIEYAKKHKIKLIVHAHELEHFYEKMPPKSLKILIQYPSLIIANSNISAKVLSNYGRKSDIEICYPAIKTQEVIKDKSTYISFRKKLGIADTAFLWVMSGSFDENKNPHLFVDIAFEVLKIWPNALFMWIGTTENELLKDCKKRVSELNLEGKIIWMENKGADYYKYFNCADGFVLTSLKESFSLVTLEALLLELPVVTQNCGGVKEILRDDIGQIIEQLNSAPLMAQAMINCMSGEKSFDIEKGKQRAKEFDIEVVAVKWNQILTNYFY